MKEEKIFVSVDKEKIKTLLKEFKRVIGKDLLMVLAVNREGSVIESYKKAEVINPIKIFDSIITKIKERFTIGSFGAWIYDEYQCTIVIFEAGPKAFFISIFTTIARIDLAFIYAYLATEKITRILEGKSVSLIIPKMFSQNVISVQYSKRKIGTIQKIKMKTEEHAFKLILGGDDGVGKKSVVQGILDPNFQEDYRSTVGSSIMKIEFDFKALESKVRFVAWNLAGQPQFKRVRQSYLSNAEAGILVYDVNNRRSFENIENWYKEIIEVSPETSLILIGNKTDLERRVTTVEGETLAKRLGFISYIESSPKIRENIYEGLKLLALQLIINYIVTVDIKDIEFLKEKNEKKRKEKEVNLSQNIEKIKKMVKVSDRLRINMMRNALKMDEDLFLEKIFDWAEEFGFVIDGDYIITKKDTVSDFIDTLDKEFALWEKRTEKI